MSHPFDSLHPSVRGGLSWLSGVGVLALGGLLGLLGGDLKAPDGRPGGMALQLAGDPVVVAWIVSAWSVPQRALQQNLLILDYGLIVCYGFFLALASLWASTLWAKGLGRKLGTWMAWASWAAALCDAIENAALLLVMRDKLEVASVTAPDSLTVTIGWIATVAKWSLIEVALIYVAASAVFFAWSSVRARAVSAALNH